MASINDAGLKESDMARRSRTRVVGEARVSSPTSRLSIGDFTPLDRDRGAARHQAEGGGD